MNPWDGLSIGQGPDKLLSRLQVGRGRPSIDAPQRSDFVDHAGGTGIAGDPPAPPYLLTGGQLHPWPVASCVGREALVL